MNASSHTSIHTLGLRVARITSSLVLGITLTATGCATGATSEAEAGEEAAQMQDRLFEVQQKLIDDGADADLELEEQEMIDSILDTEFTEKEMSYMFMLEATKLAPHGLTLQDLLENPVALDITLQQDPEFRSILLKIQDSLGLTAEPGDDDQTKRIAPIVAFIIAVTIAAVVWYTGYVFLSYVELEGDLANEYCDSCYAFSFQSCAAKGAPHINTECVVDGTTYGSVGGGFTTAGGTVEVVGADTATSTGGNSGNGQGSGGHAAGRGCVLQCGW